MTTHIFTTSNEVDNFHLERGINSSPQEKSTTFRYLTVFTCRTVLISTVDSSTESLHGLFSLYQTYISHIYEKMIFEPSGLFRLTLPIGCLSMSPSSRVIQEY